MRSLVACLMLLAMCTSSSAQPPTQPSVRVIDAWARATPPGASTAAAYMIIASDRDDELLQSITPIASDTQVHEVSQVNGMMQMRAVTRVAIQAGVPKVLAPQTLHLMMMGLKQPLRAGTRFAMTLKFAHAGNINIDVQVRNVDSLQ